MTITDTLGLSATSLVTVVIAATPTAVLVTPPTATVVAGGSQAFSAAVNDQFAQPITPLPAVTWATAGGGTIATSGVFTATTAGGPFAVTATVSGVVGTAAISVTAPANQPPTIATPITTPSSTISGTTASLSVAGADDGGAAALRYTWSTIGAVAAPVGFTPNGSNAASATTATFTASGSYTLQVAITDAQGLSATSSIAIVVNLPTQGPESGLDFPGNVAVQSTMRFKFTDPHLNGLPAYGPNGSGVTYIWRAFPRQQAGYYTTFFWGNDDGAGNLSTFYWRGGSPDTYYGAHPYPRGSSQSNVHDWEISTDEADFVNGEVVYGRWYTQALRVWSDAAGKHYEFYWDLPNTDAAHRVVRNSPASYGNINPPAPALTFGDAPWRPGEEVWNGILRGIQIYAGPLSLQEMLNEANTPLSTQAGASAIWYLNSNPTPSDISDKSGRGHNPVWVGAERPTLYTGGAIGPSNQAPTIAAAATPSANPVTGTAVTLSVLGADDQGEPTLAYDWSTVGAPPGPVSFSANGTNGAKTTVASFSASGIYTFRVTVRDSEGLTATSTVSVTVNSQTPGNVTFGESTLLPNVDGGNGDLLVAMQAAVPQGGTLQSLSFYITNAAGQLRLGVYDASGPNGGPGALVATTNAFTPVVGWNTVPSTTAVTLPAGTYWLAYLASSSSLQFLMTPNGSGRWYSVPFGALPSTYSTSPAAGAYHWSFYGTLSVVP
ncbi:MAG: PKD domain-containing protein [Gemmatimonadaceae bacterium]|nr:PKD domain-containing protein [Gemmatimonadaceae bacterium]